jgi:hypothetical protein
MNTLLESYIIKNCIDGVNIPFTQLLQWLSVWTRRIFWACSYRLSLLVRSYPSRYNKQKKLTVIIFWHTPGVFLTFFIILIVICFGTDKIRPANPKFAFSVATMMMLLATAVSLRSRSNFCSTSKLNVQMS